jgi:hypothetical protein
MAGSRADPWRNIWFDQTGHDMVEVKRLIDLDMLIEIEADAITAEANPHT